MNKVKSLFKASPIAVVVVGLLITGIASAALVDYLSNTVTADIEVKSPMALEISMGEGGWTETLSLSSVYGGEEVTFYTREENLANVAITGNIQNIVTSPGITCEDFKSVIVRTKTDSGAYGPENVVTDLCDTLEPWKVQFNYPTNTWEAGQVDINEIVVTFEENVIGTYEFTNLVIPIPTP